MKYDVGDKVRFIGKSVAAYKYGSEFEIMEQKFPIIRKMWGKEFMITGIEEEGYVLCPNNLLDFNIDEQYILNRMACSEGCFVPHDSFAYNLLYGDKEEITIRKNLTSITE